MVTTAQEDLATSQTEESYVEIQTDCAFFEFVYVGCVLGVVCVLGYIGNVMCLIVLRMTRRTSRVTLFLLKALAITDLFYIFCYSMILVWPKYVTYFGIGDSKKIWELEQYAYTFLWPGVSMAFNMTTWLTVLVTGHRFVAVCYPLRVSVYSTIARARWQVATVAVVSILIDIPRFLEVELKEHNSTIRAAYTPLYYNDYYELLYKNGLVLLFRKLIPLSITIVLSWKVIASLYSARYTRNQMLGTRFPSDNQLEIPFMRSVERKITKALMVVIITFIICQMPGSIYPILRMVLKEDCGTVFYYFYLISDGLTVFNSSINFMIYMLCSAEFRKGFICLCLRICCQGTRRRSHTFSSSSLFQKLTSTTGIAGIRMLHVTSSFTRNGETHV